MPCHARAQTGRGGGPPERLLPLLLVAALAMGCALSSPDISMPRSALQQVLVTEAIERALDGLEWPSLEGQAVSVRTGTPGQGRGAPAESIDERYLKRAAEARLVRNGARIVDELGDADYTLLLLAGALSLDRSRRFFGIEGTESGWIPFTFPMIAIYDRTIQEGFAKTEIFLSDARAGGLLHASGPATGKTFARSQTFLFILRFKETDTSRPPVGE